MAVQVLVATMDQTDHSLLERMNIRSEAIIGNQTNCNSVETFDYGGNNITYLNFSERGVGQNRNNALIRATGTFCLFADDDMVYKDNYVDIVEKAYSDHANADVIIFNLEENGQATFKRKAIKSEYRVNWFNFLRFGAARISVRTKSIKRLGIMFNQCFGGGTEYCHGEDNLFLADCLRAGLKVIALPISIAYLSDERPSTWNSGFTEKYVMDQGALFRCLSRRFWRFFCLQDALRRHKSYGIGFLKAYRTMVLGAKQFRNFV